MKKTSAVLMTLAIALVAMPAMARNDDNSRGGKDDRQPILYANLKPLATTTKATSTKVLRNLVNKTYQGQLVAAKTTLKDARAKALKEKNDALNALRVSQKSSTTTAIELRKREIRSAEDLFKKSMKELRENRATSSVATSSKATSSKEVRLQRATELKLAIQREWAAQKSVIKASQAQQKIIMDKYKVAVKTAEATYKATVAKAKTEFLAAKTAIK